LWELSLHLSFLGAGLVSDWCSLFLSSPVTSQRMSKDHNRPGVTLLVSGSDVWARSGTTLGPINTYIRIYIIKSSFSGLVSRYLCGRRRAGGVAECAPDAEVTPHCRPQAQLPSFRVSASFRAFCFPGIHVPQMSHGSGLACGTVVARCLLDHFLDFGSLQKPLLSTDSRADVGPRAGPANVPQASCVGARLPSALPQSHEPPPDSETL